MLALVVRPRGGAKGSRERRETVVLTLEDGVVGDRWVDDPDRQAGAQVSLINVHVVHSLARTDEQRIVSGDNLHVDLCLTEENLPVGTRLQVGEAVLEVSEVVHRACRDFVARLGATAAKKVARAGRMGRRGRGVLCRVVEPGEVRVGSVIRVLR